MAENFNVNSISFDIGTLAASGAGTIPLMFVPKSGGAITLLGAHFLPGIAPTGTINTPALVTLTDATTPVVSGTLGTAATWTATSAGGTRVALTLTTAYVQPGTADMWIGLKYGSGTIQVGDPAVTISYMMGR